MSKVYKALLVRQLEDKSYVKSIEECNINDLPKGELLIKTHYSSLNYKDILSCSGNRGVTRHYPHTPGIDVAGIVEFSSVDAFKIGDKVVVSGSDMGENIAGGFGQYVRIPSKWAVHLPLGLSLKESMIYGTAGYTAGLSIDYLINQNVTNQNGEIIVTGATGGVGSISVAILSKLNYEVVASSGKSNSVEYLNRIGSCKVIGRENIVDKMSMGLMRESWSAAIDSVGGDTLSALIKSCKKNGIVIAVGMVSSTSLNTSVFPFILRGVNLKGINATIVKPEYRQKIWEKLANEWKPDTLKDIATIVSIDQLEDAIDKVYNGKIKGRVVVDMR